MRDDESAPGQYQVARQAIEEANQELWQLVTTSPHERIVLVATHAEGHARLAHRRHQAHHSPTVRA
jgi:hypothetical protein